MGQSETYAQNQAWLDVAVIIFSSLIPVSLTNLPGHSVGEKRALLM